MEAAPTQGACFAACRHSEPSRTFVDLKSDTEYELRIRVKNDTGEGPPPYLAMRTNPAGDSSNIIQFPER